MTEKDKQESLIKQDGAKTEPEETAAAVSAKPDSVKTRNPI